MKLKNLRLSNPIMLLGGAILSIADPITDILTLLDFYRTDHKTWFAMGLTFVILPCLVFPIIYWLNKENHFAEYSSARRCIQTFLCGCNPFSAALAHLEGFVLGLKKWWFKSEVKAFSAGEDLDGELVQLRAGFDVLFESILESAPQTILQLYAMSVQIEPVDIIQIISLPVSFLSLARAFITLDEFTYMEKVTRVLKVKHKVLLFVSYLFVLSSRLFAITYFTISYKWWVIGVLLFHTFVMVAVNFFEGCYRKCSCELRIRMVSIAFFFTYWISDFTSYDGSWKVKQRISQVLFVAENIAMILLYYLSDQSNTWYSLPVTVCVCAFSILGAIIRVTVFHYLLRNLKDRCSIRITRH